MSEIKGWYYLHENKELIYKNSPDAIVDIRDSDLCHTAWAWDGERPTAWSILVEAASLGAKKERIRELAEKWQCNDEDAHKYAEYVGIRFLIAESRTKEDTSKMVTLPGFKKIGDGPIGIGDTYLQAMSDLCKKIGYVGGKMWEATFADIVKSKTEKDKA